MSKASRASNRGKTVFAVIVGAGNPQRIELSIGKKPMLNKRDYYVQEGEVF